MNNDIDIIMDQTGIADRGYIESIYFDKNNSVSDTIMALMNYKYCKQPIQKPPNEFDAIRVIVAEKEELFSKVLDNARNQKGI